jgi:hypothetical protein
MNETPQQPNASEPRQWYMPPNPPQPPYPPQQAYGQPWPQQPPQVVVQQNNAGPRRAVTRRPMGIIEGTFHWTMIICTAGLWLPVYLARRRSLKTVTKFR